jgi:hypothetical protein
MYSTPILFLIFNKPDSIRKVFDQIRKIQPQRLYIAADGPRRNRIGEEDLCIQAREVIDSVDWPCTIQTLFREKNFGCKKAVSEAISWFFEQEEYGVILEEDCLPDLSFFPFCEELLIKYKDDDRIGHIGGNCFLPGVVKDGLSYDFCSITHIWGWATWRRVWKNVEVDFPFWIKYKKRRSSLFCNKWEEIYFTSFISDALSHKNGLNPWAVFYYYSLRLQHQLSIYPAVNMVSNIGLNDTNATHTLKASSKLYVPAQKMNFPLQHPDFVMDNKTINRKAVLNNFFSYKRLVRYIFDMYF